MNEKAIEFVKPYIEANNYFFNLFIWILAGLIIINIGLYILERFNSILELSAAFILIKSISYSLTIGCVIVLVGIAIDNNYKKKFPMVTYNEKIRFIEKKGEVK